MRQARKTLQRLVFAGALLGSLFASVADGLAQGAEHSGAAPPLIQTPGQLSLTAEQQKAIRERIAQQGASPQPVPRAFAVAVGMTSPPELRLRPLPEDLRDLPRLRKNHRYALLDTGALLIVSDRRLIVAVIEERLE